VGVGAEDTSAGGRVVVSSQATAGGRVVVSGQAAAGGRVVVSGQATRVRVVGSVGVESVGSLTLGRGVGHGAGGQPLSTNW
jgi:hypothetical protein